MTLNATELALYRNRFAAIAEEMGEVLRCAAFSPNIKERLDHSCAIFDAAGDMIALAAHIPVHLGACSLCVKAVIAALDLNDGETAIVNDPFAGGTHLPDITLVTAVDVRGERMHVASRAHHADVGGIAPGSLPSSRTIDEEGWRCRPRKLDNTVVAELLAASRTPWERRGDIAAQQAANRVGAERLCELGEGMSVAPAVATAALREHARRLMASVIAELPRREVYAEDVLDDARGDGVPIRVALTLACDGRGLRFDFRACDDQVSGPMNAVRAIVESAVFYALLCVGPDELPPNAGVLDAVEIVTRPGSVVDAQEPAAVAAGNVETSQRLVDVILQALAQLLPERIPASSYGTMNNVLIGSLPEATPAFVYYETLAGGLGGGPLRAGASATQAHMTNTRNTPIEALEHAFPLRIRRYSIREGSGGAGRHPGGDGLVREYEMLDAALVTVIAERRTHAPPGAAGGAAGAKGAQWVRRGDERVPIAAKGTRELAVGDCLIVETPGGGGWGATE